MPAADRGGGAGNSGPQRADSAWRAVRQPVRPPVPAEQGAERGPAKPKVPSEPGAPSEPQARSEPRAQGRRRTPRDPHWDNVRLLSGTLVLLSHLTESLTHVDGLTWMSIATWAMRVPVFVVLAGYFSSAGPLGFRELRQLTEAVLVPYLLIGLVHTLQLRYYYGTWEFFTAEPAWGLWFLLSLFFWRMLLPVLSVLRYPLATSLVAALAVGYVEAFDSTFSASRTVTFLPFFLLGWKLRQTLGESAPGGSVAGGRRGSRWRSRDRVPLSGRELMHSRWSWCTALGVVVVTGVGSWLFREDIDTTWLAMRGPYDETVPLASPYAWGLRGMVLLCGMLIALSFIRLVPKRRIPVVSYLGAGGLYIYLLHPPVVRTLTVSGDITWVGPWPEQLALLATGAAIAVTLASPPVRRVARPLVQPRLPWLYAEQPRQRRPEAPGAALGGPAPQPGLAGLAREAGEARGPGDAGGPAGAAPAGPGRSDGPVDGR